MSASCIYSDYWLVNWSSKVIIQYQGADLDLKYFKWALYMEMLYMCFKIIGKSTIRPSLIKLYVTAVLVTLSSYKSYIVDSLCEVNDELWVTHIYAMHKNTNRGH